MADEATTGGSFTQQSAEPSSEGAPVAGTPLVPGTPAPQSQGTPDLRGQLDSTFRKGYSGGREKGRKEAEQEILALLGVDSVDSLRTSLETKETAATTTEVQQRQAEEAASASVIRKLQTERAEVMKRLAAREAELERYQRQSEAALRAEARSRLISLGAHPEGVDDLVAILSHQLRWAADGQSIEVIERDPDGTIRPARESYAEFLESVRGTKRWFFNAPQRTGSGSAPGDGPKPAPQPVQANFAARYDAYRKRPQ